MKETNNKQESHYEVSSEEVDVIYEGLQNKRDFLASVVVILLYLISYFSGTNYGYVFCSMFIFHLITLAMVMKSEKLFAIDRFILLIPIGLVGFFTYLLSSSSNISTAIADTISDSVLIWFLMGVLPVFVHRGFNHLLGITFYDR